MSEIIKTTAIVLNSVPCTVDGARDLELFSIDMGKIFARARGVEKPKAKLAAATQPFCFGEFSLAERGGRYTITDVYVHDTFFQIAYNLDGFVIASSFLEIASKLSLAGENNLELFKLLVNSLKAIVYDKKNPSVAFIEFVVQSLNISGLGLDFSKCGKCGKRLVGEKSAYFVYEGTGILCPNCANINDSIKLSTAEWEIFKDVSQNLSNQNVEEKQYSRDVLVDVMKMMIKQFYFRTGEKIKSLDKYF